MTTLQIVDEDLTTVLFDFEAPTGAGNPFGVITNIGDRFGLGRPETEMTTLSPSTAPGGHVVQVRDPLTSMQWNQRIRASSGDVLRSAVGELARLLAAGGHMKFVSGSDVRFIDFEPSPMPALIDGRPMGLFQIATHFEAKDGVVLSVTRQPYLHEAELDPAVNKAVNPTLLYDFGGTANRPDDWTGDGSWATGLSAESIDADRLAYRFTKADGAAANLQQTTAVGSFAPGDVVAFSFYARVLAVAGTPRMQATVQFKQSDGTTNVGSLQSGGLVTLTTVWQRITVITSAAGALTSRAQVSIQVDNNDATAVTILIRNAQPEVAPAPTSFRVPAEVIAADPASTTKPRRMLVWAGGDAPSRAKVRLTADAQNLQLVTIYRESLDGVQHLKATLHKQAESGTLGADTASVADANASGGNTAEADLPLLAGSFGADVVTNGSPGGAHNTFTMAQPAGTIPGDVLILIVSLPFRIRGVPKDWVYLGRSSNIGFETGPTDTVIIDAWVHVVTDDDPPSYTFSASSSSGSLRAWLGGFHDIDPDDPVAFVNLNNGEVTGTTTTFLGATTDRDNTVVIAAVAGERTSGAGAVTTTTPSGSTPTFTEQDDGTKSGSGGGLDQFMAVSTGVLAVAGATGDPTATMSVTSDWTNMLIGLNPGPAPAAERVRQTWSGIPPGSFDVWCRLYPTAATKVRLKTRWALEGSPTEFNEMVDTIIDVSEATSFEYAMVRLGRLTVPPEWGVGTLTVAVSVGLEEFSGETAVRLDYLDLVGVNEFVTSLDAGQLVGATEDIVGDGVLPKVFHLDSVDNLRKIGKAGGPVPVLLEPGFQLLTFVFQQDVLNGWTQNRAKLTAAPTVAVYTRPANRT